jgi:tetratricopeptide (TPR) repeat protein
LTKSGVHASACPRRASQAVFRLKAGLRTFDKTPENLKCGLLIDAFNVENGIILRFPQPFSEFCRTMFQKHFGKGNKFMRKDYFYLVLFTLLLITLSFLGSSCSQQTSQASPAESKTKENLTTAGITDARVKIALDAIEKMPDSAGGYLRLAVAYIQVARENGDFSLNSKAESAVKRALEIEPDNLNALKLKTSLFLTFHKFADALELAVQLSRTNPQDPFIFGALTDANIELGNYAAAIDAAQKMVDLRPDMSSYTRVAYVRSLHGDTKGAIKAYALAARIADPLDKEAQAWCRVYLGHEYFKTGQYKEAEQSYDSALQILPNYHLAMYGKAQARAAFGDYQNAINLFSQVLERVPNTEMAVALGNLYDKTGNAEKAKQQYDLVQFIEQQTGNTDQRQLALMWADQDIKLDEALEIARREYSQRKDIYTADILAWCLYKKGQLTEAQKLVKDAMNLKTKDARLFYHAGLIEKGLNNQKEAERLLKMADKLNPAFDLRQAEILKKTLAEMN